MGFFLLAVGDNRDARPGRSLPHYGGQMNNNLNNNVNNNNNLNNNNNNLNNNN